MEWLHTTLTETEVYEWETIIGDWFFVFALGFLAFELLRYLVFKNVEAYR